MCEKADLPVEINRRVLLANLRFRRYGLPLYGQPHRPGSKYGCSKPRSWRPCYTGVSRGAPPWPISPYCGQLTTDCSSTASDGRGNLATATTCFHTQMHWPRLALRTSRRRCESRGYFSRGLWLVWTTKDYQSACCWHRHKKKRYDFVF